MRKINSLIIIVLILSILLVSGCVKQASDTLTNNKELYDKTLATPTPTPNPTVIPTNTSTPTPIPK